MSSRKKTPAKPPGKIKAVSPKRPPAKKAPAKNAGAKKAAAKKAPNKPSASKKLLAKNAERAGAPKASPLRGLPVLQWVRSRASAWQAGVIANLIELVSTAVPQASCSIKWGQPVFELNGPVAFIRVAKEHVTFGFWRGAELTDPAGLLEGGARMKHVKIGDDEAFDRARVVGFVREAAALNIKLGDPTKRSPRLKKRL
jgi:hypothetical protein